MFPSQSFSKGNIKNKLTPNRPIPNFQCKKVQCITIILRYSLNSLLIRTFRVEVIVGKAYSRNNSEDLLSTN